MASLTRNGRQITVPDDAVEYYAGKGWTAPEFSNPQAKPLPDGEPSEAWTIPQLTSYAGTLSIDLGKATKKGDILAAILAAVV